MPAYDASIWDRIAELETRLRSAESELIWTRRRLAERQTAVLTRPAITVETEDEPSYPPSADGEADLPVITLDVHELGTPAEWEHRYSKSEITAASRTWLPPGTPVEIAHDGVRWRVMTLENKLTELCAKATAERNVPYLCWKGVWDATKLRYCYDTEDEVYAIDHRMGAPHAEEGWKGLYQRMPADFTIGEGEEAVAISEIWVCVSLDCEEPPEGCTCNGEE